MTDNKIMAAGILSGLIFAFGVVRIMIIPDLTGAVLTIIGLLGVLTIYLYDRKNQNPPKSF